MEEVFKTFLSILLILTMAIAAAGIISTSIDVSNAKSFQRSVVSQIENSNFSEAVIAACIEAAEDAGYTLTVTNKSVDSYGRTTMAEVILEYKYSIPFLNSLSSDHKLRSFAR